MIRCALCSRSATSAADQGGVLVPDVLRVRRGGWCGAGEKRSRQGAPGVACSCLLCCVLLRSSRPDTISRNAAGGYRFAVFPGGTLRRAGGVRFYT